MKSALFLVSLLFAAISIAQTDSFNYAIPNQLDELEMKSLWATEYYAHVTSSEGSIPYLSEFDDTLGYFSDTCDFCTACLEGTVFIENKTEARVVLNYASRADTALVNCRECAKFKNSTLNVESWGSVRWKVSSGFGEGVKGYKLIPYRTIAVDKNHIAYGNIVFIPDAVGTEITKDDGTTVLHDGYFFAGDTGGAIKTNHIDVFTGIDGSHPFSFVKPSPKQKFKAYIVTDAIIIKELKEAHQK
ncbi:MAG: 3D (Asp-Asp-Asp) domain-containing protein [Crocinitomicaceae bacterium]|jgi:3D (Asp-Asp-Asp) domain-containing protein